MAAASDRDTVREASAARSLLGISIVAATMTACSSLPYEAEGVRADASRALASVQELTNSIVPEDADVIAHQRLDRCSDIALNDGWQPSPASFACFAVDITVVRLDGSRAEAAEFARERIHVSRLVDAVDWGDESMPLFASGTVEHDFVRYDVTQPGWVTSTLSAEPMSYVIADPIGVDRGAEAQLLTSEGEALIANRGEEPAMIECDCLQWWLIVVERYDVPPGEE
ncbi:hypothetical protein ABIB37_001451 [Agrococcus sp. UYP10]|uniref:hypothetical protein n=1 Tax=Agrococcus sp. UYP10 TaxID=1756355 RepID=UPI003390B352